VELEPEVDEWSTRLIRRGVRQSMT